MKNMLLFLEKLELIDLVYFSFQRVDEQNLWLAPMEFPDAEYVMGISWRDGEEVMSIARYM